ENPCDDLDPSKEAKALMILMQMLTEDKLELLEDCTTLKDAIDKIEADRARNSPNVRVMILQELTRFTFPGPGKMKEYLQGFEDLVKRFRMTGADFKDDLMLAQAMAKLPPQYDPTVCQFDGNTTFAE